MDLDTLKVAEHDAVVAEQDVVVPETFSERLKKLKDVGYAKGGQKADSKPIIAQHRNINDFGN